VICLAHVSNRLGCVEGDFEKGHSNGARSSIALVTAIASAWAGTAPLVGGVGDHATGRGELTSAGHP
jgi:hypothetical protein